jgi:hypothetical protein
MDEAQRRRAGHRAQREEAMRSGGDAYSDFQDNNKKRDQKRKPHTDDGNESIKFTGFY